MVCPCDMKMLCVCYECMYVLINIFYNTREYVSMCDSRFLPFLMDGLWIYIHVVNSSLFLCEFASCSCIDLRKGTL